MTAARERGERLGAPIVLLGGTAMAAWQVREHSYDVHLYTTVDLRRAERLRDGLIALVRYGAGRYLRPA